MLQRSTGWTNGRNLATAHVECVERASSPDGRVGEDSLHGGAGRRGLPRPGSVWERSRGTHEGCVLSGLDAVAGSTTGVTTTECEGVDHLGCDESWWLLWSGGHLQCGGVGIGINLAQIPMGAVGQPGARPAPTARGRRWVAATGARGRARPRRRSPDAKWMLGARLDARRVRRAASGRSVPRRGRWEGRAHRRTARRRHRRRVGRRRRSPQRARGARRERLLRWPTARGPAAAGHPPAPPPATSTPESSQQIRWRANATTRLHGNRLVSGPRRVLAAATRARDRGGCPSPQGTRTARAGSEAAPGQEWNPRRGKEDLGPSPVKDQLELTSGSALQHHLYRCTCGARVWM